MPPVTMVRAPFTGFALPQPGLGIGVWAAGLPPPSFLVGASFGSVIHFTQGGIGDVCGRILSSWQ